MESGTAISEKKRGVVEVRVRILGFGVRAAPDASDNPTAKTESP
jgi:hypothetical protein